MASHRLNEVEEDALRRVLKVPEGRVAIMWALNLRTDKSYESINRVFSPEDSCTAYNEGVRRAGQDKVDVLRADLHDGYQALMTHLLETQNQEHLLDLQEDKPLEENR